MKVAPVISARRLHKTRQLPGADVEDGEARRLANREARSGQREGAGGNERQRPEEVEVEPPGTEESESQLLVH